MLKKEGVVPKDFDQFLSIVEVEMIFLFNNFRYLQEYTSLGTAGGLHHFRDQIRSGNPDAFFVLNGDVCADFPLKEMKQFHHKR